MRVAGPDRRRTSEKIRWTSHASFTRSERTMTSKGPSSGIACASAWTNARCGCARRACAIIFVEKSIPTPCARLERRKEIAARAADLEDALPGRDLRAGARFARDARGNSHPSRRGTRRGERRASQCATRRRRYSRSARSPECIRESTIRQGGRPRGCATLASTNVGDLENVRPGGPLPGNFSRTSFSRSSSSRLSSAGSCRSRTPDAR